MSCSLFHVVTMNFLLHFLHLSVRSETSPDPWWSPNRLVPWPPKCFPQLDKETTDPVWLRKLVQTQRTAVSNSYSFLFFALAHFHFYPILFAGLGVQTGHLMGIVFVAFVIGVSLMGALWCIYNFTGNQ